tara:strand:+ start:102 stop:332 length:231 start_codon:yes stop_codon:yes gene_type:complete
MKGFFYTVGCNEVHDKKKESISVQKTIDLADSLHESIELALSTLNEAKVKTQSRHWATISFKVKPQIEGRLLICKE